MAAYPGVIPTEVNPVLPVIPFGYAYGTKILKTEFENGSESRRLIWNAPRMSVSLIYKILDIDEAMKIFDFYQEMHGPYQSFSFFYPQDQEYTKIYCGTATGGDNVINLPCKTTRVANPTPPPEYIYPFKPTIYKNNIEQPASEYNFRPRQGPDLEDQFVADNPFLAGDKFHISFTGRLKITARFDENPVEVQEIKGSFASFTINLVGLQSELI